MNEKTLLRHILGHFGSMPGIRLFRNNVGVATFPGGEKVVYGLCPGSSDLIGWKRVTITPDMVGEQLAQFVAIEVKGPGGKTSTKQINFLAQVEKAGGIPILAIEDMEAVDARLS